MKLGRDPVSDRLCAREPRWPPYCHDGGLQAQEEAGDRKIPDVAKRFGIKTLNPFQFARELDFTTDWRKSVGSIAAPGSSSIS